MQVLYSDSALLARFDFTPDWRTLTNDKFTLWTTGATPAQIADPFDDIDISRDYNSIRRSITLRLKATLEPLTKYRLYATGVKNAGGVAQNVSTVFETSAEIIIPNEPTPADVEVVDHSVHTDSFQDVDAIWSIGPASAFEVVDTDPVNGEIFVESDYNDGRVTLTFTEAPADRFINSTYIRVQRKLIGRGHHRWETVPAEFSRNTSTNQVFIDFPSVDATPLYHPAAGSYFTQNYKYRVRVLKTVGT